ASQGRHVKSLGASPEDATPQVLSLEKAMPKAPLMHGQQNGAIGRIPGATFDPSVFRYFAKNYSKFLEPADSAAVTDPIERLKAELDNNAMHAENVSLYRLAQTWRIIKYVVERGAITLPEVGTKAESGERGKMQSSVGVASQPDLGKGLSRPPLGTKRPSTEKGISAPMTTDSKPAGLAGVIGSAIVVKPDRYSPGVAVGKIRKRMRKAQHGEIRRTGNLAAMSSMRKASPPEAYPLNLSPGAVVSFLETMMSSGLRLVP
ncbi:SEA (Seh1-associated) complex subunit, partial [Ascosphaera atra]